MREANHSERHCTCSILGSQFEHDTAIGKHTQTIRTTKISCLILEKRTTSSYVALLHSVSDVTRVGVSRVVNAATCAMKVVFLLKQPFPPNTLYLIFEYYCLHVHTQQEVLVVGMGGERSDPPARPLFVRHHASASLFKFSDNISRVTCRSSHTSMLPLRSLSNARKASRQPSISSCVRTMPSCLRRLAVHVCVAVHLTTPR